MEMSDTHEACIGAIKNAYKHFVQKVLKTVLLIQYK
jgi:hypothetical protein